MPENCATPCPGHSGIKKPSFASEINSLILAGERVVSLECLRILDEDITIPCGTVWVPPLPGAPIDLNSGSGNRLVIDGAPLWLPRYKIFENYAADSVSGFFGGTEIWTSWWEDCDVINDFGPVLDIATHAARSATSAVLPSLNPDLVSAHGLIGGSFVGSTIVIPAGVWRIKTPVDLTSTYSMVKGHGNQTKLVAETSDPDGTFKYLGPAGDSGFSDMSIDIMPSSNPGSSLFYFDSGFLEDTIFERLIVHGAQRAVFRSVGTSLNHFQLRNSHFVKPNQSYSVGIEMDSTVGKFNVDNTTFAGIGSEWKHHVAFRKGGNSSITNSHFESASQSSIYYGPAPYVGIHNIENCQYNHRNGFAGPVGSGSPFIEVDSSSVLSVRAVGCIARNTGVAISDLRHGSTLPSVGDGPLTGGILPTGSATWLRIIQTYISDNNKYVNWYQ